MLLENSRQAYRNRPRYRGCHGGIFRRPQLDASSIEELEEALFATDFGYEAEEIVARPKRGLPKGQVLGGGDVAAIGAAVLKRVLEGSEELVEYKMIDPTVICLVGVNGSGKTTTTAKLGQCKADGRQVLVGLRYLGAAAIEQLKEW